MDPQSSRTAKPRRTLLIVSIGLFVVLGGALAASQGMFGRFWQRAPVATTVAIADGPELNLLAPDALIEAEHLSQLPKDLLKAPFLADLLSDDFVFYYEHNAEKLALIGTLRRLAFERNLTLPEQLISQLLDTQAQVALWKARDGKLTFSLARLDLGLAAPLGQAVANFLNAATEIAQTDVQLKSAGELTINKDTVPFFSLRYLTDRSLAFGFYKGSLVVASHMELIQDSNNQFHPDAQKVIAQLFTNEQPFKQHFNLTGATDKNKIQARISVDAHFFTLGYQDYLPALAALRFDLNAGQWESFLALKNGDHAAMFDASLWANAPADASLCAFMPVQPQALNPIITEQQQNPKILQAFTGRSFICWFANTPLAKPLIGAELAAASSFTEFDAEISALFDKAIRNNKLPRQAAEENASANPPTTAASTSAPSNMSVTDIDSGKQWQKSDAKGRPLATLARKNAFLLFSLYEPLIQHGLDTLAKQYPALGDKLPNKDAVALFVAPGPLSNLLQNEIRQTASDTTLGPLLQKLAALGKKPAVVAQFDASSKATSPMSWYPLNWNAL
ncbi:MAG TPA: DUF2138 family protein [Cellvibrionaceae bacterium]